MINISFRTFFSLVAGALIVQSVSAQTPGEVRHESIHKNGAAPQIENSASVQEPARSTGSRFTPKIPTDVIPGQPAAEAFPVVMPGTPVYSISNAGPRKYSSLFAREREAIAEVVNVHRDFYPSDDFLHILSSPGRKTLIAAPFRMKARPENVKASMPGGSSSARLYHSDSSLTALVAWYGKEYGFDFKVNSAPFSEGESGEMLTIARAVKRIDNSIVTIVIWNPTSAAKGRKNRDGSFSRKTNVEIQESAYRPRGELIVEGPDAVVEFSWKVPYRDLIQKISVRYQLDPYLLAALVQQESGFNASAVSVDSALGLTQMIPATAAAMGVTDPTNPHQSIDGGARYLKMMLQRFNGNAEFALAAYNAGPGNVEKYHGIPPFAETRDYVKRIMTRYKEKAAGKAAPTAKLVIRS
ncbi:MAG: lytic transglycosylase [Chlorobi bacterium]|nr:lytic transglycosylase [Chlorobiota bacterium]